MIAEATQAPHVSHHFDREGSLASNASNADIADPVKNRLRSTSKSAVLLACGITNILLENRKNAARNAAR
jgi:hypothetical protein